MCVCVGGGRVAELVIVKENRNTKKGQSRKENAKQREADTLLSTHTHTHTHSGARARARGRTSSDTQEGITRMCAQGVEVVNGAMPEYERGPRERERERCAGPSLRHTQRHDASLPLTLTREPTKGKDAVRSPRRGDERTTLSRGTRCCVYVVDAQGYRVLQTSGLSNQQGRQQRQEEGRSSAVVPLHRQQVQRKRSADGACK